MMVVAMTVNCGGNDGAIDDDNVMRLPSPTGPLHRAFRKHVFRPRGTAKPVLVRFCCFDTAHAVVVVVGARRRRRRDA